MFFWGTIYRSRDGRLYVRYLYRGVDGWYWDDRWLAYVWFSDNPAPVSAS